MLTIINKFDIQFWSLVLDAYILKLMTMKLFSNAEMNSFSPYCLIHAFPLESIGVS